MKTVKCKYCGQKDGVHKMGCETRKITIIMSDISMCSGKGCELKEKCYRYTAQKSKYMQSYFTIPPIKGDECDMYWGEKSQSVFNLLKDITDGKSNDKA